MAHEIDLSNNRANMAYRGETPWHGLGTNIDTDASLEVWAAAAGMEWEAIVSPLISDNEDQVRVPGFKLLYRSDTKVPLSVVSEKYKPVQPSEVLEFFNDLVQGIDSTYKMETAGCLRGGKKIWALAKCNESILDNIDRIERYLLLATSFDRSIPTIVQETSVRVVCNNTLSLSLRNKDSNMIRVTHNRKFAADQVKRAMGIQDAWAKFAAECEKFIDHKMTESDNRKYFAECLAESNPHRDAESYLEKDDKTLNMMMEIHDTAPGSNLSTAKDTLFGSLNTVTYYFDHKVQSNNQDNRLNSAWFGRGNRTKNFAFHKAVELVS